MAFVFRTRIVQYADLVGGVQTVLADPVVAKLFPVGEVYPDLDAAVAALPVNQRPAPTDLWKYRIEWRVQSYVIPTIRGVVANTGRLVFDADMWDTQASWNAAKTTPQRQDTFIYEFTSSRLAGARQAIRQNIDDSLLQAAFFNLPPDGRDPRYSTTATNPMFRLVTSGAEDVLGLMSRSAITDANGVADDLPARWRTDAG